MFEKRLVRPNAPDPTGLPPVPHVGTWDIDERVMLNREKGPFKGDDLDKNFKDARAGGICLFDCLYQSLAFVDRVATQVPQWSDWMRDQRAYLEHIRNAEGMRNFICDCILEDKAYYENIPEWNRYIKNEWKNVPSVKREGRDDLTFDECIHGYTGALNMRSPQTFGSDLEIDQACRTFGVIIYKYMRNFLMGNVLESSFLHDTFYPSEEVQASAEAAIKDPKSPDAELFFKTPRWILVFKPADPDRPGELGNHYDYMLPRPLAAIRKRGPAPPAERWWERKDEPTPKSSGKQPVKPVNLAELAAEREARRAEKEAAAAAENAQAREDAFLQRLKQNLNKP